MVVYCIHTSTTVVERPIALSGVRKKCSSTNSSENEKRIISVLYPMVRLHTFLSATMFVASVLLPVRK